MRSETGNLDKYRFMNGDHNSNTEYLNEKDKDGDRIHCILIKDNLHVSICYMTKIALS